MLNATSQSETKSADKRKKKALENDDKGTTQVSESEVPIAWCIAAEFS
jgi:hypothetical protein